MMYACAATNPPRRRKAALSVYFCHNGRMNVRVGDGPVLDDVTTALEIIVLAACRGGYRPVGQPDKVIYG